jgi:glutamate carboxypeptidase
MGFEVRVISETDCGNHIQADKPGEGSERLLFLAHLDVVPTENQQDGKPFRIEGDLAYGPGVGDMKGGIVQMLYALRALQALDLPAPPVSMFLTADEERGSLSGRAHIEELAGKSSWALVMEPASRPGSIAIRRWGILSFTLDIRGRAAHVLKPGEAGVNATSELALKILALQSLSDPVNGVKVSVNHVRGGSARQVSAARAWAEIDVRVRSRDMLEKAQDAVRRVAGTPALPGIALDIHGRLNRPPMEPNPRTEKLLEVAADTAREIGIELHPSEEYGGSDGCFTADMGVATLDGLGPVCHDMCGAGERIELSSVIPRTTLLAGLVSRLAGVGTGHAV